MGASLVLVLSAMLVFAGGQATKDTLDPDVVDLREVLKNGKLDREKAKKLGLDPQDVEPPKKIKDAPPRYPSEAVAERLFGTVVLQRIIDMAGEPSDCRAISGPRVFHDAALGAVEGWRWTPLRIAGTARRAAIRLTIRFRLF